MTIQSKQQTTYTVKQTKPTKRFFESHYCHVCSEKFKKRVYWLRHIYLYVRPDVLM